MASTPEGRLQAWDSRGGGGGGGGLLRGLSHPELVAALDEFLCHLDGPRVDQVTDVARQFAEEKGGLCVLHRLWLQGGEVVPQDGGPGVATHGVIQPLVGHLLGAEAIGLQEELLQLLVWVADGGGVSGQRADGGDQQKWQFSQGPVELCNRMGDVGSGECRVETIEPRLQRIGVEIWQADGGSGDSLLLLIIRGHGWVTVVSCV